MRPDFVRILDKQETRLHFFAEVMGGVLRLDIQSYLFRDDHKIQSPALFIGKLFPQALSYFARAHTPILWKQDEYRAAAEDEGLHGDVVWCPNDNFRVFGDAVGWNPHADAVSRERAALRTWSGRATVAQGFTYESSTIIPGVSSIKQIRVFWNNTRL